VSRAVCPGSFDPVTLGHLDIVRRAARIFDEVIVAVGVNASKNRLFSSEERMEMLRESLGELPNVRVAGFSGLVTAYCQEVDAVAIVKGLRASNDYDYELPMAHMNRHLTGVETLFLPGAPGQVYVSSSLVKEVAKGGGDVTAFLPATVHDRLRKRLAEQD
jgi:pantetheine-phosphate adenylyltransferase